jgi:hypothetical protein
MWLLVLAVLFVYMLVFDACVFVCMCVCTCVLCAHAERYSALHNGDRTDTEGYVRLTHMHACIHTHTH